MGAAVLVVVTPARNEAENITPLVASVAAQSRLPDRWIIVDDGSTDGTHHIAERLCEHLDWASVIRLDSGAERTFASKVGAVHAGFQQVVDDETEIMVNLDADAELPETYFERLEAEYRRDEHLGVLGGVVTWDPTPGAKPILGPNYHVPGPGQSFRRTTWDAVGGYWALPFGGEDVAIYVAAAITGWTSRSLPDLVILLRRETGAGGGQKRLRSMYARGRQDYDIGRAAWFEMFKLARWLRRPPPILGALARGAGYFRGFLGRRRSVDADFVRAIRHQERSRLRAIWPGSTQGDRP